jgi:predicted Ser/Thr protein kinase
MSPNPPLPDDGRDSARHEPLIRRFEAAWLRGEQPAIDAYLPADAAERRAVLVELVHADLECRLKAGEAVRVESYLQRYPELATNTADVIELIATEFDLRRRTEPNLDPESYYARFPQFYTELAARWRSEAETKATTETPGADLPLVPGYDVLDFLARGGMGAVYRARQQRLDRIVALKMLVADYAQQPNFVERFGREARALARLNHPHIIAVHDFGETDGQCYLVMEYVDGQDLRQLLRAGKLQPELALRIVQQVCSALQYAHEEGIIHRDIKPENVLLDKKGRVKVADFGLAKLRVDSAGAAALTGSQQVVGTLHYMAPEQLRRPTEVDARVDVYALGVLFYEMLTGDLPLGRFPPPSQKAPGVDGRLDAILFRMLEQEPERRFATIAAVQAAIEELTVGHPSEPEVAAAVPTTDGLSLRFFLGAFGVFLCGWLLLAASANHGLYGLLVAGLMMLMLACAVTGAAVRRLPELRRQLGQRSRKDTVVNTSLALVLFALGLGALVGSFYAWWDRPVLDPNTFAGLHRNQEQRLLQQLSRYEKEKGPTGKEPDLPQVELVTVLAAFSAQERLAWWLLLSGPLLILGASLLSLETVRGRISWSLHWQPALMLTTALLLPPPVLQVLASTLGAGFDNTLVKPPPRRVNRVNTAGTIEQLEETLHSWAAGRDYEIHLRGIWALETLRDRRPLARILLVEARAGSVFDRWRISWRGAEQHRPLLRIQCLCGVDPPEAIITLDAGSVREGTPESELRRSVLDSLQEALQANR